MTSFDDDELRSRFTPSPSRASRLGVCRTLHTFFAQARRTLEVCHGPGPWWRGRPVRHSRSKATVAAAPSRA
eukprot:CAMPEP_0194313610 /NCGR_PEP_ID=MMETSP0171-20130528/10473_1 /TAXON_ID=218684 /ORGANISM="Corethron pennatum, Strain L29A3" /LENGTH=71 /DNA_ID=CAMNT_0039068639 /DNA_START=410 /DNA_END=622 /DNA_ORIENTATION=+